MSKILIIGGTGTIGQELVNLLEESNQDFTVLARTTEKAAPLKERNINVSIGELGNWDTLKPELEKADTIFLLTGPSEKQAELQNTLIDLAKDSKVKKIVKISSVGAEKGSSIGLLNWHGQTEEHLINSNLDYVILRPHTFMQNMLLTASSIKNQGAFYQSTGDAKIPFIDIRDIALASYDCLINDDHNNCTYELTGPEAIKYDGVAKALSNETGKDITCVTIPFEAHIEGMKQAGLPNWLAEDLVGLNKRYVEKDMNQVKPDFENITNEKQRSIQDFAQSYGHYFI